MCGRGQSDCSPGIFVSKVESAQFGNSLDIDRDLSQRPWVGQRGSGDITGSASPCGRQSAVAPAVPLLFCVWMRAALSTSCMVDSYWLTIAQEHLHARTAALVVFGP